MRSISYFILRATLAGLVFWWCGAVARPAERPNIVVILADDLGFSDVGCYGGEIRTPNVDGLAARGIRFSQFYNGARCCPSRASLLTGLYAHQAGVGDMVDEYARKVRETLNSAAYSDRLSPTTPTIAEVLREAGYRTAMSGKWHLGYRTSEWPAARGFDRSFALIEGAMNYYGFGIQHTGVMTNPPMALDGEVFIPPREGFFATEAFTDYAVRFIEEAPSKPKPFFLYLAYTAPHWPLHARPETVARYRGKYKALGWDKTRAERHGRLVACGIITPGCKLAPRPGNVGAWEETTEEQRDRWDQEMAIYAAQVEEMDAGIGRVAAALKATGQEENTLVLFLSDNGGAAEDPNRSLAGAKEGTRESYEGYGVAGAHVSSTPFRKTKKFTHEGGISGPLIVRWPAAMSPTYAGTIAQLPCHLIDLLPTCLEAAGTRMPRRWQNTKPLKPEGISLLRVFRSPGISRRSGALFWEHEGHRAARAQDWKIVASIGEPWELYDLGIDRAESANVAGQRPEVLERLVAQYERWASRVGVKDWPVNPGRNPGGNVRRSK